MRPRKASTPAGSSQKAREEKALLPLELQDDGSDSEWGCLGQLTKLEYDDKSISVKFAEVDNYYGYIRKILILRKYTLTYLGVESHDVCNLTVIIQKK